MQTPLTQSTDKAFISSFNWKMSVITLVLGGLALTSTVHAGDCWVATAENLQTGFGDTIMDRRHAAFLDVLHKTDAALKSDPAINAIPNVRYQSHLYIGVPYHAGAAKSGEVSVYLHNPEFWKGECSLAAGADTVHFVELSVKLNDITSLGMGTTTWINEAGTNAPQFFDEPKRITERDGYPIYATQDGNRALVMSSNHIPAFVPMTAGEYLDYWHHTLSVEREQSRSDSQAMSENTDWSTYIEEMRKTDPKSATEMQYSLDEASRLAQEDETISNAEWNELQRLRNTLTPVQRAQAVFLNARSMDHYRFGYAKAHDEGVNALVKLNPDLWSGKQGDSGVRTVTLHVNIQDSENSHRSGADRWLDRVDLRPYRELLSNR